MNRFLHRKKSTVLECDDVEDTDGSPLRNVFVYQSHCFILQKIRTSILVLSLCSKEITRLHTTEDHIIKINSSVYPAL
jgi:hypothetical protein